MVAAGWHRPNLNVSSVELDTVELLVLGQSSCREERTVDTVETFFRQDARGTLRLESSVKSSYLAAGKASLGGEGPHHLPTCKDLTFSIST